jgi:hypothetical protein
MYIEEKKVMKLFANRKKNHGRKYPMHQPHLDLPVDDTVSSLMH